LKRDARVNGSLLGKTEKGKFEKKGGMLFIKGWYRNRWEPKKKQIGG
jgi:hypothetical protein